MNLPTLRNNQATCSRCHWSQRPCAGRCLCTQSGTDVTVHQESGDCPLSLFPPPVPEGAPLPEPKPRDHQSPCANPEAWGPKYWAALHTAAARGQLTPTVLARFTALIPCPECRKDFADDVAANPLPADPAQQPRWAWGRHDRINAKLDKPRMPYEAAVGRWAANAKGNRS